LKIAHLHDLPSKSRAVPVSSHTNPGRRCREKVLLATTVCFFNAKIHRENSMAKKFDGVIEAVRYKDGQIEVVRMYERRGAAFSDRILVPRHELLERLKKGQKIVIGQRRKFLAGTFDVQDKPVQVINRDGKEIITTNPDADHNELEHAPLF
jgi:hypothetical protein